MMDLFAGAVRLSRLDAASSRGACAPTSADGAIDDDERSDRLAGRLRMRLRARLARVLAVARVETLHVARDRTSLSLILVVPALQIALFGQAVNVDPREVPIAIARDGADPDDRVRRAIAGTGYFAVVADGLAAGAAEEAVRSGRALVAIELPRVDYFDLDADPDAAPARARVLADATDPAAVRPALAALEVAFWREAARAGEGARDGAVAGGAAPGTARAPAEIEWLYNEERRAAWTILPALAGVVVMISMLMLGALTLVRERERGTWEALLATPVDALDALAGKLAPYVVLGSLQAALVIAVGWALFDLPIRGDVAALALAAPLYASAHLLLGFALSALAESQLQAIQGAVVFYLPSMLLSGFLFPFHGMPAWARAIGEALPLTHFARAARGVLLRGEGAAFVGAEMVPVAGFAAVALAVALVAYRARLD